MKQDARVAFDGQAEYDGGYRGLAPLLSGLDKADKRPKLHLVGHSAGAIVLGNLLSALKRFKLTKLQLGSVHLMAPACTIDFFKTHYGPYLSGTGALKLQDKIYLYNLSDALERDDTVSAGALLPSYSASLLYLVSRAYEETPNTPLAGMQVFKAGIPGGAKIAIDYAVSKTTASRSHGGFDNDVATISNIISRVMGSDAKKFIPPTADELTGY
jgi:hypothetical protein